MTVVNKTPKEKLVLFYTITLLTPVIIFVLIEILLRLFGYRDGYQDLFINISEQPEYMITSADYGSRYFPNFKPQVAPQPFLKDKKDNIFRVVVIGGSSTQGFPYHFYNSFSGRLEQKLFMHTQDLNIEVINLGMTAVNSYVLWDLKDDIAEIEPDAVIIYAGHNEFYGSFGVGSSQFGIGKSVALKRLIISLKNLRIYQFIEELLRPEDDNKENRTMMARVVKESQIELDGDIFQAGLKQYRKNMESVISYFKDAGIDIYIGDLASNLKGQKTLGESEQSLQFFEKAEAFYQQSEIDSAFYYYNLSKEYDEIRFRAPDAMNEIIYDLADAYSINLVNTRQASIDSSYSGIPDDSFFDDHLHPNYRGNQVFGELFYEALTDHPGLEGKIVENVLSKRLPMSQYEYVTSTIPIIRLESGYPFIKGLTRSAELQKFDFALQRIIERSYVDSVAAAGWRERRNVPLILTDIINQSRRDGDSLMVMDHYLNLTYLQLFNENILRRGVEYSINNRNLDYHSTALLELVLNKERDNSYFPASLGTIYLINSDYDNSEYWLKEAESMDPDNPLIIYNLARLKALQADTAAAFGYFEKYRKLSIENRQN